MTQEESLKKIIQNAASSLGVTLQESDIVIERSKEASHGDYSTNVAMKFSRVFALAPREVANKLSQAIQDPSIEKIEIAGPGFINFFMKKESLQGIVAKVLKEDETYGQLPPKGKRINIEFVSANPTGDLHLGHTRIAAVGDSIANLLSKAGYDVTREYYLNDCGNQVEHLGHSLCVRYHELFGEEVELGEDDYHGVDLIEIAKAIKDEFGDRYLENNEVSHDFFIHYGIEAELKKIRQDMADFGVKFDRISYESDIRNGTTIEDTIAFLKKKGYVYMKDDATFLKTTSFLDDKDRPIVKSDGMYTYFMPDICYHYDKMSRGYDKLIDVLGADHHGYIARMKSALMMKGYPEDALDVELVQIVRVYRDGAEVKMSKRTGKAITHRELVEDCGVDAVRYLFLERSPSSHLDFNYNLAMEQSSNNPVFYAQYAHARCHSLLNLGSDIPLDESAKMLKEPSEMSILKHLADFPSMIEGAAESRAPYKVASYIHRLAELIHEFYAACRIIDRDNLELTSSRLALIKACGIVLRNALGILGVSAPEKM